MEPPASTRSPTEAYAVHLAWRRRRRARRRLVALASFLLVGLALGNVWATGFATTGGAGTAAEATPIYFDPGNKQDTSGLNAHIRSNGDLTWHWQGQWGNVDSLAMYTVDLDDFAVGEKFFVGVFLTNIPTGFADLQLQLRIKDAGNDVACTPTDMDGVSNTNDYRVFTFETTDAQVTFAGMNGATGGLPGGRTYCVGIANYDGSGQDSAGTFIRRSSSGPSFSGQYPTFIASLNQM